MEKKRYACFTLDYELDYGGRVSAFDTLHDRQGHKKLRALLDRCGAPLSAFVQTSVLNDYSDALSVLHTLASEVHSHSHTHATQNFDSQFELSHSLNVLSKIFKQDAYGYRAPYGKLYEGDEDLLKQLGYSFDSSIFPSIRPGKFNHLGAPIEPYFWENGLREFPFAVLPKVRLILGISYMKLFGPSLYRWLIKAVGLPEVLIFYGHMHDYFPTSAPLEFSPPLRYAFGRHGGQTFQITRDFLELLQTKGYEFVTMNQLNRVLAEEK
jgi:peptidoglycan/xylan/chitin deacetylase (PgdA/CDA1 family)